MPPHSSQHRTIGASNSHTYSSDEIDLRDLALVLWGSRYTIVMITAVAVALAAAYVFLSTPVYQVQATALPPAAGGLEAYNKAYRMSGPAVEGVVSNLSDATRERLVGEAIPALSSDDAYQYFIRHLSSSALRRDFFESHYLPVQNIEEPIGDMKREQLWRDFIGQLTVAVPTRRTEDERVTVTWQGSDPRAITQWTNAYIHMGVEAAQSELANNLTSALKVLSNSLTDQLKSLRAGAENQRKQQVIRLTEALRLAESIGLNSPPDAGNLVTSYSGETAYMRGADALRNEIILLKNRVSDDAFIPELTGVLMRQALLETVNVSPGEIAVARVDEIATLPTGPIKPRKALILALGLVLGGMLGVFVVLVRNMFRR